jgi:hypothetical protein
LKTLYFIICFFPAVIFSQHIYISPEFSISSIKSSVVPVPVLNNHIQAFNIKLGIDYLEHENYFISSNIGYKQRGGNEKNPDFPDEFKEWRDITKRWNYISLDSYINYKVNLPNDIFFFLGVGPEINFLLSKDPFANTFYEGGYRLNKMLISANGHLGFTKTLRNNLTTGVYTYYNLNLSNIGTSGVNNLKNSGFSFGISLGYNLKMRYNLID